jgi:hypothetical protein
MRSRAMEFLREAAGVETIEYAVAAALLVTGVLIGLGGLLLAILPMAQRVAQTIFTI